MILIDANLLLYAYNSSFDRHTAARTWLEDAVSGPEPVGLAWLTILAFVRIATNTRAFEFPLTVDEATAAVTEWIEHPNVDIAVETPFHWTTLTRLVTEHRLRGPAVMDAHLAALALDYGATLCTTDRDFERFTNLRVLNPLA